MANNDLKICSTSLVIREMQIKAIENCHFIQTSLAKEKKPGEFRACRKAAECLTARAKPPRDTIWQCLLKSSKSTHSVISSCSPSRISCAGASRDPFKNIQSSLVGNSEKTGSRSDVARWQNGEINCDMLIQWKTIHQRK